MDTNEEVIELEPKENVEEVGNAKSKNQLLISAGVGLGIVAGVLCWRKIIKPTIAKIKKGIADKRNKLADESKDIEVTSKDTDNVQ